MTGRQHSTVAGIIGTPSPLAFSASEKRCGQGSICGMGRMGRDEVVNGTLGVASWWLENRQAEKILSERHDTFNPNPFLLPLVAALHGAHSARELSDIVTIGHLMGGNNTGFGKLIDERLLPLVFGTQKLTKGFRAATPPYRHSAFNDVDHLVKHDGKTALLSLKASRWTINLGAARDLNRSFAEINDAYLRTGLGSYSEIAVGVLYGSELTDKYEVVRGETVRRREMHDLKDLMSCVNVYAGRAFWAWLNHGEDMTQDWVLEGIIIAARRFTKAWPDQRHRLEDMASRNTVLEALGKDESKLNFHQMMREVNG